MKTMKTLFLIFFFIDVSFLYGQCPTCTINQTSPASVNYTISSGTLCISGSGTYSGNISLSNSASVCFSGNLTFTGSLTVENTTSGSNIVIGSGVVVGGGSFNANGSSNQVVITNNGDWRRDITIRHNITFNNAGNFGQSTARNNFTLEGNSILNNIGSLWLNGLNPNSNNITINSSGSLNINTGISVQGNVNITAGTWIVAGSINLNNTSNLVTSSGSTLTLTGTSSSLNINTSATIGGNLNIPGNFVVNGSATATIQSTAVVDIDGDLTNNNSLTIAGKVDVGKDFVTNGGATSTLQSTADVTVGDDVVNNNNLYISGSLTVADDFTNHGGANVVFTNSMVNISGDLTNNGNLSNGSGSICGGINLVNPAKESRQNGGGFTGANVDICDASTGPGVRYDVNSGTVDPASLDCICAGLLPLNFVSVSAMWISGGVIKITWQTGHESVVERFYVERLDEEGQFKPLGIVFPHSSANPYEFIDTQADLLWNYYRIRAVEVGGRQVLSKVVTTSKPFGTAEGLPYFWPNPVSSFGVINMFLPEAASVEIFGASGNRIFFFEQPAGKTSLPVFLPSGAYWIRVAGQSQMLVVN